MFYCYKKMGSSNSTSFKPSRAARLKGGMTSDEEELEERQVDVEQIRRVLNAVQVFLPRDLNKMNRKIQKFNTFFT